MLCKEFYFSSGDYISCSRTCWVVLVEGRIWNNCMHKIILNVDQWFGRCRLKNVKSRALAAI